MNRNELIGALENQFKTMSMELLKEFYDENGLTDYFEKVLFIMPKNASLEDFRKALAVELLYLIQGNNVNLTDEDYNDLINTLQEYKKGIN
jgi:hypothetical protein